MFFRRRHLVGVLIGRIVVRGPGGEFGRTGIDGLEGCPHAATGPGGPDGGLAFPPEVGKLRIGKTEPFGPPPVASLHGRRRAQSLEPRPFPANAVYLVQEPGVDAAFAMQQVGRHAPAQGGLEVERPVRGRHRCPGYELIVGHGRIEPFGRVAIKAGAASLERTQRFLQRLREIAADGHRLADRLHPGPEDLRRTRELLERPTGYLRDHVIDRRFEAGRRLPGYVVADLVQGVADRQPGGDLGDREARGFGRQCARA